MRYRIAAILAILCFVVLPILIWNIAYIEPPEDIQGPKKSVHWKKIVSAREIHFPLEVHYVHFSPDGKNALAGTISTVHVFELASGKIVATIPVRGLRAIFNSDGQWVISGGSHGTISIWDWHTQKCTREWQGHETTVYSLSASDDGKLFVSSSWKREPFVTDFRVWKVDSGEGVSSIELDGINAKCAKFIPSTTRIMALSGSAMRIYEADGTCLQKLERNLRGHFAMRLGYHELEHVAFSKANPGIAFMSGQGSAAVWDLERGRLVRTWWARHGTCRAVACSPTHHWGLTAGGGFEQTGRNIDEGFKYGTGRLWNLDNAEELCEFAGHTDQITSAVFSPDGRYLLTGSYDKTVRIWEIPLAIAN